MVLSFQDVLFPYLTAQIEYTNRTPALFTSLRASIHFPCSYSSSTQSLDSISSQVKSDLSRGVEAAVFSLPKVPEVP